MQINLSKNKIVKYLILGFDLNQPYNWIKAPNFQIYQDKKVDYYLKKNNIQQDLTQSIQSSMKETKIKNPFLFQNCENIVESPQKFNNLKVKAQYNQQEIQNKILRFKYSTCFMSLNKSYDLNCSCMNYLIGNKTYDFIQFQDDQKHISFEFYKIERQFSQNSLNFQQNYRDGVIGFPFGKNKGSIIQEYINSNIIKKNSFSLYLYFDPSNLIQPCVVVGGFNKDYFQGQFNYTQMHNYEGQYSFRFDNLKIGSLNLFDCKNQYTIKQQQQQQNEQYEQRNKQIQHFYENRQNQKNSIVLKTENADTQINETNQYIGVLSTKELFIQIPLKVSKDFINIFKSFKIYCKKNKSNIVECIKHIDSQFPDLEIEIRNQNIENDQQQLHLKGENYIWECKRIDQNQNIKSYFQLDYLSMKETKNSINNYQICKTFFQVNEQVTIFTFGFSFMEKFYIHFDIDNQVIGFSQISRKSNLAKIINHSKLNYIIGPLVILIVCLYYYINFRIKTKQNESVSLNFCQQENNKSNLLNQA
ncbi:transmembrane protein, putative (macronuclear) [Tetrahymena thermophila SB210]|uniref:Transmembrane protein, putative n=1 Tax=Tetrahymena thermophila (strain SB210) TaxID=312017 RepID=W7X0B2_TETTS|nr:transmembrane protein, putative [Tetrahymena thermophila SB210]EWS71292.1 transmembrane protein, putative [Tetrahymena thermophila SB210]|eukprot:XP_012656171.1 transmembrane protein, putative [Tetrahymena thermophila SB210]